MSCFAKWFCSNKDKQLVESLRAELLRERERVRELDKRLSKAYSNMREQKQRMQKEHEDDIAALVKFVKGQRDTPQQP